jgi:hypothetical protein
LCTAHLSSDWLVLFASWASILGEALTGKGTQAQFDIETGIPLNQAEPLLLFFILFTLLGAIGALGDRRRFVDAAAPITGLDRAVISPGKGPTFGFTKANELFVGRLAQLGIAFMIIGEIITGEADRQFSCTRKFITRKFLWAHLGLQGNHNLHQKKCASSK